MQNMMNRQVFFSGLLASTALLAAAAPSFASALAPRPAPSATDAATAVMAAIERQNPSLGSFQARVHVDVQMHTFPWLAPKLDGTAYFKRPDNYEVVFDRVPSYAHGITHLFGDIADPWGWRKLWNVSYVGTVQMDGRSYDELAMTKKIHSDQIKQTLAFVDKQSFQVARMEWDYTNGGKIVMTQTYRADGPYTVVASQHADIRIPHVHATADANYTSYETNVAVNDAVFQK